MTAAADDIVLLAPLRGWVLPVEETPDPVFAEKMLGEGIAIDPTFGELRAPCAGEIINVHASGHAVTVRAEGGAEILLHIGLETVGLAGKGFERLAAAGDKVAAGDLLVRFDLDRIAPSAKSLVSPMVITNGEAFHVERAVIGREVDFGEPVMWLRATLARAKAPDAAGEAQVTRTVRVGLAHGVHARPAARLAREAARFSGETSLALAGRGASARSAIAMMTLGVRSGDEVQLAASGADAEAALDALARVLAGEGAQAEPPIASIEAPDPAGVVSRTDANGAFVGVAAAPGLAIGAVVRLVEPEIAVAEGSASPEVEREVLTAALSAVSGDLRRRMDGEGRDIVEAHLVFLDDPELRAAAFASVGGGASAGAGWKSAIGAAIERLDALGDARMAERTADLADLERQVLLHLGGEAAPPPVLPQNAILLAADLLPSQLLDLDRQRLAGLALAAGGPTSHVALLAQSMNIPAVVALGPRVLEIQDGAMAILDGVAGRLRIAPGPAEIAAAQTRLAERRARHARASGAAQEPCRTADGERIEVFANLASPQDARLAVSAGAEGCGLLRTEFLFLDRLTAPDEDEQAAAYQAIADALERRPLVIRTLDIGGDKPVAYLPLAVEANPALGLRGIRVSLARPDLLRAQLRAALRVRPAPAIMAPMIASLEEFRAVRRIAEDLCRELAIETPQLGVMIETPAAAVTADLLAAEADFLSIGTNDLAQYVLAMDRTNSRLAAEVDAMHPAVLRLVAQAVAGGRAQGKNVAVCGGLASDLAAAPILIGLGVRRLSAASGAIPELKAVIRELTLAQCDSLAGQALKLASASQTRSLGLAAAGAPDINPGADR